MEQNTWDKGCPGEWARPKDERQKARENHQWRASGGAKLVVNGLGVAAAGGEVGVANGGRLKDQIPVPNDLRMLQPSLIRAHHQAPKF